MSNQSPAEALDDMLAPYHNHARQSRQGWVKGMTKPFPCDCSIRTLKTEIAAYAATVEREAEIRTMKKWRTMIQRLSEYVDSPDSLNEYDEALAALQGPREQPDDAIDYGGGNRG